MNPSFYYDDHYYYYYSFTKSCSFPRSSVGVQLKPEVQYKHEHHHVMNDIFFF